MGAERRSRRWAAVLTGTGLAIAVWLAASGASRHEPLAAPPRLEPDSGGHLERVLLHFTPEAAEDLLPTYRDLLLALSDDTEVLVAVEAMPHYEELRRALGDLSPGLDLDALRPVVIGRPITAWSRDRFATARRGGRPLLVIPPQRVSPLPHRANDWIVPWILSTELGGAVDATEAAFDFDGGDLIADERGVYATALLLERNRDRPTGQRSVLIEELRRMTGLDVVLIGGSPEEVPDHHIGMFLTPLGNGRAAVGDPAIAHRVLSGSGNDLPHGLAPDWSTSTRARFETVARAMTEAGLDVTRLPLVPTLTPQVYLSYNNVLIDDRPDGRHVLVPQYGVDVLDEAAVTAWRRLGAEVHPVDVSRVFRHGGAIRCLAAVVERGGENTRP